MDKFQYYGNIPVKKHVSIDKKIFKIGPANLLGVHYIKTAIYNALYRYQNKVLCTKSKVVG
ncbi:hypothetical protein ED312_06480 [Sinomicrobium pectinilyticum]|uniref:Uncharacterized protein n=1 Tax=Sinomicrobium pectinilyticum TaxID=1084421 RepID=A0A3N0ER28_SINP1|nr:hypothetical protein ED312_06480 [Sinomicrobium pectinilyticum]